MNIRDATKYVYVPDRLQELYTYVLLRMNYNNRTWTVAFKTRKETEDGEQQ